MKTLPAVVVVALAASTAAAERDRLSVLAEAAARSNAGDHAGAIALYERAYLAEPDPELLPILASEYRRAGLVLDAKQFFCDYLAAQPKGAQAAFAASQVLAIHAELGEPVVRGRICVRPAPVRVDFAPPRTPARARDRGLSKRELAGVATAVAGLASLGASLYYDARARDIASDITGHDPSTPWSDDIHALQDRGQRFEDRAQWFAIAGGAALVTAGVLYFTGRADRLGEQNLVIAPTASPTGGGISFSRGF